MKKKPAKRKTKTPEVPGAFPTSPEYLERHRAVLHDPECPYPQIDHEGFGTEVSILTDLRSVLFEDCDELAYQQWIEADDPRLEFWEPPLRDNDIGQLAWELITRIIDNEVTPFGRGMFAKGVLWAADRSNAEVQAAAAMIRAQRKNAIKGGKARSRQAEPKRQFARRLDRELRKTVKKKYVRVERIAAELRCSEKTVLRYLSPKTPKK